MRASDLTAYLDDCRRLAVEEIRTIVPRSGRCAPVLYDLMLDYPLRHAKALRPALCIATCRALGGTLESVLRSAAIIELYHNAFLIHDDVEDGSESRREGRTLHYVHGVPIAVNVGDAMLALALQPLLDNMRLLGMGKALRILQVVARMARESAEGQAIELHWIRQQDWRLSDADYLRMVYKKTSWYSFITPMLIGGIVAGATQQQLTALRKLAALLGIAFQIQDDVLNLVGEGGKYGKETAGDLWEGKHTLILTHAMRLARPREQASMQRILNKHRPTAAQQAGAGHFADLLAKLERSGDLSPSGRRTLQKARLRGTAASDLKTEGDIQFLMALITRHHSIGYASQIARRFACRAAEMLARCEFLGPSVHRDFVAGLVEFVVNRDW